MNGQAFPQDGFPAGFSDAFELTECLASHPGRETYLARGRDGRTVIVKRYDRRTYPLSPPRQIDSLRHPGLPEYIARYEDERCLCLVRLYVPGEPLSAFTGARALSRDRALEIALQVCDAVGYLHAQTPPILHRDLKPENVILQPNGRAVLIDFDICRLLKEGASGGDTVCFGTRGYAPPEQYGFAPTDRRADVYAFGMTLRFLMTGGSNGPADAAVQHVIDRCTAFAPKDRYRDMAQVSAALKRAAHKRTRLYWLLAGLLLAGLCAFLWLGERPPVFTEPLIERAARLSIGKPFGSLSQEDCAAVRSIMIYGDEAYADLSDYLRQRLDDHVPGPVRTLDDLRMFPNLVALYLVRQGTVDVSAVADLAHLESVEFKHLRVSAFEPLARPGLTRLCLFDTDLKDVRPFESCALLKELDVGGNDIRSLDRIGSFPVLRDLNLAYLSMDSLEGIAERMPALAYVGLHFGHFGDLSALTSLPKLERVTVDEGQMAQALDGLSGTAVRIDVIE